MMSSDPLLFLLAGCASGLFSGFVGLTCLLIIIFRNSNWYQFAPGFLKKSPIFLIFVVNGFLLIAMVAGIFFAMIYSFLGLVGLLILLLILISLSISFLFVSKYSHSKHLFKSAFS